MDNNVTSINGEGIPDIMQVEPRTMPHSQVAEQALLGALLVDNQALEELSDFLKPEHFFFPAHQRIYAAILKLADRGQNADSITLRAYFEADEDLEKVGGTDYLSELAESVITVINARDYAQTIYDMALRRSLIRIGESTVNMAYENDVDSTAQTCLESAEAQLFELAETGISEKSFITMKDAVTTAVQMAEKAFNTKGNVTGVTTGLSDMDKKLGGLQPSDLIILAGRPSMGKTALATNMAYRAASAYAKSGGKEGGVVGIFSLEMSADQLAARVLSDASEIPSDQVRRGDISKDDFRKFAEASARLASIPLFIDDTPALSITAVRNRARRMKRKHGLDVLMVDYLQLLQGTGSKQSENRVNEVSEITRGLKAIAKELHIPVLALSQLSRAVEQREDKRPMLSDLRESGSIEQDADVVMFVYREQYYLERGKPDEGEMDKFSNWQEKMERVHNMAECIVAKQRHGPVGTVKMHFNGQFARFSDLESRF